MNVEVVLGFVAFGHQLHAKFPFQRVALLDRIPHGTAVEIGVLPGNFHRFVPHQRMRAKHGFPVEFHIMRCALGVDEAKRMHAKTAHGGKRARNRPVAHHPHQHVHGFWRQRNKIIERVVGAGRLRNLVVRLGLDSVNQVGKLDCILNKEHRNVVANNVPVAVFGVHFHRKAAHIAGGVGRTA